jgi:hypothetical protein
MPGAPRTLNFWSIAAKLPISVGSLRLESAHSSDKGDPAPSIPLNE